jgi:hemerythrin-like domain-containing protein
VKRHPGLHPLSHDHHHGLVRAERLCRTRESGVVDAGAAARELLAFWKNELEGHFREEEEIVLPALARFAGAEQPEILETLRQHAALRGRIDEMARILEGGGLPGVPLLADFGDALRDHIRFEERRLFPAVEREVPEEELEAMGARFRDRGAR